MINTIGPMTRGNALELLHNLFANEKIKVYRYELYDILLDEYIKMGGDYLLLSKKQKANFMGDLIKLIQKDSSIQIESSRHSYSKDKGALYMLDFRSKVYWNDSTEATIVTHKPAITKKVNSPCNNQFLSTDSKPSVITPNEVLDNEAICFFSYDYLINHPDFSGLYPVIACATNNSDASTMLNELIGMGCIGWPQMVYTINCSNSSTLLSLFKEKLLDRKVDSPGENC